MKQRGVGGRGLGSAAAYCCRSIVVGKDGSAGGITRDVKYRGYGRRPRMQHHPRAGEVRRRPERHRTRQSKRAEKTPP